MWEPFRRALEVVLYTLAGVYQGARQDWNVLELVVLAAFFVAIRRAWIPRFERGIGALERWFTAVARLRWRACGLAGLLAIGLRVAVLPLLPVPRPVVADEFSHLLLADTLLHGRVSNPTHPLWPHFESLHIIQQPRYVSNYFPGQGAVLAVARFAGGEPWLGVLALSGAFAAVLCWALQAWMPARWALLGAVIAVLRFSVGSYWINAFHGGFLAAVGGAIVSGAYGRLRRRPDWRLSGVLGVGLVLLACSRPFEGLAFGSVFLVGLLLQRQRVRRLAPALLVAGAGLAGLGAYFQEITGSALIATYAVSRRDYGWPTSLAWTRPPAVHHRHRELKFYYDYEVEEHGKVDGPVHFVQYLALRLQEYWRFYLGPVLSVPLFWGAWVFRRKRFTPLMAGAAAASAAVLMEGAASPHYLAPAAVSVVALLVLCVWRMRRCAAHGVAFSRVAVCAMLLVLTGRVTAETAGLPYTQKVNFQSWCCVVEGRLDKARISAYLDRQPGRHLVLVKAKTDPYNFFQWIYNAADIDGAKIVWARDLGAHGNRHLLTYFAGRALWEVDPNVVPAALKRLR